MDTALKFFYDKSKAFRLNSEQKLALLGEYLLYVFAFQSESSFNQTIAESPDLLNGMTVHKSEVTDSMRNNGRLLLDVKGWIYAKYVSERDQSVSLDSYDVSRSDKAWLTRVLTIHRELRDGLESLVQAGYSPLEPERAREMMSEALTSADLLLYVRKFTRKKMTFLVNSYGMTFDLMEGQLREAGLYSMLRVFPAWKDHGFLLSVAKMAAKRSGLNLIDSCTTHKRQALVADSKGGFHAVTLSFEVLQEAGHDVQLRSPGYFSHEEIGNLRTLIHDDPEVTELQRHYLRLCSGEPDPAFSAFLGEPNDDVAENTAWTRYNSKVCAYLGIPPAASREFLSSIRDKLL